MLNARRLLVFCCLLLALAACTFAIPAQNPERASQPQVKTLQTGVDPTSPLASSVLMQYCGSADCELRPVDPTTGETMAGFAPIDLGKYAMYAYSSNRQRLAVVAYRNNNLLQDGVLQFVDLATWQTVTTPLTFDEINSAPLFSPDDTALTVLTFKYTWPPGALLQKVDIAQNAVVAQQAPGFHPQQMRYTPDGAFLMLYGADNGEDNNGVNPQVHVALLDATDLSIVWEQTVEGLHDGHFAEEGQSDPHMGIWWEPAEVFAPGQAMLHIVHANQEQLTTVDFSARSVTTRAITPPQAWVERLLALTARTAYAKVVNGTSKQAAISPDGKTLYVVGLRRSFEDEVYEETPLGLQVIDLATGQEIAHIDSKAHAISVDPSGERLYLHCWEQDPSKPYLTEWTEVFAAATYEPIATLKDKAVASAYRLDGQPILLSTVTLANGQIELAALEPASLEVIHAWADWYGGYVGWWAMPG